MDIERLEWRALGTHLKPLTLAYLADFDRVRRFYAVDWRDEKALRARAKDLAPVERETADAVETYLKEVGAPSASLEAVAKLRRGAACVVTGQQPGLLGGPLYNLYKAATAVRLARRLEEGGVPCVAVFWNHGDDHNPAGVNRVCLPDRDNATRAVEIDIADDGRPLGDRPLDASSVIDSLRRLLPEGAHRAAAEAAMAATAAPTLGASFTRTLLGWLGAHGLVVLEPRHILGARAAAVLERARREPGLAEIAVARATERLRADGFEPPIAGAIGTSLFVIRDGVRRRLERSGNGVFIAGAPYDGGGRLSPAVALRPVLQDAALPTLAYVGGPNELAYFAQLGDLYRAFDVAMPAIFPRASVTLIEARIQRVIEKFDLKPDELFLGREALQARVSARAQRGLLEEVSRLDLDARGRLKEMEGAVGGIDRSLVDALRKTVEKMGRLLAAFRERIVESQRQADGVAAAQIDKLCNHLLPGGTMQERVFTPWYYAAMFGPGMIGDLLGALDPFAGAHLLIRLT